MALIKKRMISDKKRRELLSGSCITVFTLVLVHSCSLVMVSMIGPRYFEVKLEYLKLSSGDGVEVLSHVILPKISWEHYFHSSGPHSMPLRQAALPDTHSNPSENCNSAPTFFRTKEQPLVSSSTLEDTERPVQVNISHTVGCAWRC